MRILHVNTERGWRGGEQQLLLLARGLRDGASGTVQGDRFQRDVAQTVVAGPETPLATRAAAAGFDVEPIAMRGALDRKAKRALREAVERLGPDLVHAHTSHAHSLAWGALRGLGATRPRLLVSRHVAYSIHRHVPLGLAKIKYNRQCDALLCVSGAVRAQLLRDGVDESQLHVVSNGIDPEAWGRQEDARARQRKALGVAAETTLLGTVGALTPEKGHATLLEAFAMLEPERAGRALVLVGEGGEREALTALIKQHGLEKHVHLVGFQEDVRAWLSAFDVLAVPSLSEGFSLVTLQGLAAGLPVVASRVGGMAELFEDGVHGRYVAPADPAELALALADQCEDTAAAHRMATAGAAHVRAQFHFHETAKQTYALYEDLLRASSNA